MSTIDANNVFALVAQAAATADAIANDSRQTATDRAVAGCLRDAMKAWRGASFQFKDWQPPVTTKVPA